LTVSSALVAPTITANRARQWVSTGQRATFTVTATGTAPLSYQWQKNGTVIGGATAARYTTAATTAADNGDQFTVVVSNAAGSVTSKAAALTVTTIGNQPIKTAFLIMMENHNWSAITGTSTAPYINNTLHAIRTHATSEERPVATRSTTAGRYTTAATTAADNGDQFTVVVSNAAGSVTSKAAALTVTTIGNQPLKTVFLIMMENHNWSAITGSSTAPYINNTLLAIGAHA